MTETTTSTLDILEPQNAVKILSQTDTTAKLGGYGIVFGERDVQRETFTKDTDFMMSLVPEKLILYDHTLRGIKHPIGTVSNEAIKIDDVGIWIEAELDRNAKYIEAIIKVVEAGTLGWSSGSVEHLVRRVNGTIKTWPLFEFSLTPTPAEPRTLGVEVIKKMAETDPSLKALLPEDAQESIDASATAGDADANVSDVVKEVKNMSEAKDTPILTADAIGKALGVQLKESLEPVIKRLDDLEKEQPVKDGGTNVSVTKDADDNELEGNPFKSFGEFLQLMARNDRDSRLRAVKSSAPGLGGYFDVTKAMGPKFVGSMAATKAPTGLQEGIPSAGGFLVGTDRAAGLLSRVYNVGQLIQRTDMVGISAGANGMTFYAEDETSRVDGSRRGGIRAYWAAEAEEKTKSKPKFREMELKLRKAIGLVYATDELLADASALESWIMQNLPEELSFVVEDSILNGTGVGMPLGILTSGATVSVAKETGQAAATIVAENISKMWARRWLGGRNYVWLYNQDVEPELDNLNLAVGTGGSLVYMPAGGLSQAPFGTIKGAPAIPVEYCATLGTVGDFMLVDLGQYQMIDKGGVQSDSSIHVRFVYDETVFRFVYRVDGQPKWDAALTPYKGTSTVSPFITLATRE